MTAIRSSKLAGPVSILLMATMMALFLPAGSVARADGAANMLLIFPVLDTSDAGYPEAAERMTDALQVALGDVVGVRAAEFSRDSPMVRRAVKEGRIRSVDVEAPVTDPATAIQIGYALGVDEVCVATITAITVQAEPRQIEVVLSGQCYQVAANVDEGTRQVVERPLGSGFGVTGQSRARAEYTGSDRPLLNEAVRSAAMKAAQVLAGQPAEEIREGVGKRPSTTWKWIVFAAAVAGLAMIAHNSTEHPGSGVSPDALAPRPDRLLIEPTSIRLLWQAPQGTSLQVLRYQIQRSVNSGAWNFIDEGNVDATDTDFADFSVQAGNTYRYRMLAQYATSGPSAWAYFENVTFPD